MTKQLDDREVLDQIKSNGAKQMSHTIENWSPTERVVAARKSLYQIVEPHLRDSDCPPDVIAETEALFEGVFKTVEVSSLRSGSRSSGQ